MYDIYMNVRAWKFYMQLICRHIVGMKKIQSLFVNVLISEFDKNCDHFLLIYAHFCVACVLM